MVAKLTQEEVERRVYEIWGDSLDLSQAVYKNYSHKMRIRCKEHNVWFEQNYGKLMSKQCGCPQCAKRKHKESEWVRRGTQGAFITKCKELYGEDAFAFDKLHYIDSRTKVTLRCNSCGEYFDITPNKLLTRRNGCTNCSKNNQGRWQRDL